jgi:hypothetical protein
MRVPGTSGIEGRKKARTRQSVRFSLATVILTRAAWCRPASPVDAFYKRRMTVTIE